MSYTIWPDGWVGEALQDVYRERQRQEDLKAKGKFAYTCADLEMSHAERSTVLGEECGEVCHEVNEGVGAGRKIDTGKLRSELVQTAAVAIAWIEAIDKSRYKVRDRRRPAARS